MALRVLDTGGNVRNLPGYDSSFRVNVLGASSIGLPGNAGLAFASGKEPIALIGATNYIVRLKRLMLTIVSGGTSAGFLDVYLAYRSVLPTTSGTAVDTAGIAADPSQSITTANAVARYLPATVTNGTGGGVIEMVKLAVSATAETPVTWELNFCNKMDLAPTVRAATACLAVGSKSSSTTAPGAAPTGFITLEWEEATTASEA